MQKVTDINQYDKPNLRLSERRSGFMAVKKKDEPSKIYCKACNVPEFSLNMCSNCKQYYCQDCMTYGKNTCRDCSNIQKRKAEHTNYIISKGRSGSISRYFCGCF